MKHGFLKKASAIALSLLMLGSVAGTSHASSKLDKIGDLKDVALEQPVQFKTQFAEFAAFEKAVNLKEFWNSVIPEDMEKYFINSDGSVNFRTAGEKTADEIAKKEAFEKSLKDCVARVESYCSKNGIKFNTEITDGKGGLLVGSSNGDGQGTNSLSVSGLVKGDVLLLNDGGVQLWGAIMHAGIYDGTSSDLCIYSASPNAGGNNNNVGVRWERVSDWRKNDQAWTLSVKGTSTAQRKAAFDYVKSYATLGESYTWYCTKNSTNDWYCSKIPWFGYKKSGTNIDIDYDGGYWVWPIDIYNSSKTNLINYYP